MLLLLLCNSLLRCLGCLHGLVQLELGCDPAGLTIHCLAVHCMLLLLLLLLNSLHRCLGCLHGLVQLELGCDPAGLTDLGSLTALSNLRRLALRGLSLEAGEWGAAVAFSRLFVAIIWSHT
jgi:hypothetical protein